MWAGLDLIPNSPTMWDGKRQYPETVRQLQKLGAQYEEIGGVIVISPDFHDPNVFPVNDADPLPEEMDWDKFQGLASVDRHHWDGLPFLAESLQRSSRQYGVPVGLRPGGIDQSIWGSLRWMFPRQIPMPVLPVGTSDLGPKNHYRFGQAIRKTVVEAPKPIAILVSSNLTHREDRIESNKSKLPSLASSYDQALLQALQDGDWTAFDALEPSVVDTARPDGQGHLWSLIRGIADGLQGELRHYSPEQGAFGMAVVHFETPFADAA